MYRFLILAYDKELSVDEMPDHYMPGTLNKCTEIFLDADGAADALAEAKRIIIAKNYHIRRIEKVAKSND